MIPLQSVTNIITLKAFTLQCPISSLYVLYPYLEHNFPQSLYLTMPPLKFVHYTYLEHFNWTIHTLPYNRKFLTYEKLIFVHFTRWVRMFEGLVLWFKEILSRTGLVIQFCLVIYCPKSLHLIFRKEWWRSNYLFSFWSWRIQ